MLFDAGRTPDGLAHNLRCLGIDPLQLEAVVLSHGHFDHTTGLDGFVRAVGKTDLPVVIHPAFWSRRRVTMPGRDPWELPSTSRSALEGAGFDIVEQQQPSFVLHHSILVTGEVDRTNDFEPGFPVQDVWRADRWEPDPLVLDDQAVIVHVRDRGLVVMTGCGHAGVVNTVRYAQRLTGVERICAIIGGFHLNGPIFEPLIPKICEAFAGFAPDVIVPAHCTGWRAIHRLAALFPAAFVPNSVGTRIELRAPERTGPSTMMPIRPTDQSA
ncbi:MAG: MBL fold metallo-hydrolase [Mycobacteriales bacterium]